MERPRRKKRVLPAALLTMVLLVGMMVPAMASSHRFSIDICHATGSNSNPYVTNSPSASSISDLIDSGVNGHGSEHLGPVWPETDEHGNWGDIIPPFGDPEVPGGYYPGQNWTEWGQAFYANGCNIPPDDEPTEVTPTAPTTSPATCEADGSLTIPTTTGVTYTVHEGTTATGTVATAPFGPGDYFIVATASSSDYVLIGGTYDWQLTVQAQLTGLQCDGPTVVTPTAPTTVPASCAADGSLTIPTTTGVTYTVYEGTTATGTVATAPFGPGEYFIVASASSSEYALGEGSSEWQLTVQAQLTGAQCDGTPPPPPPPPPPPAPAVTTSALGNQVCPDGVNNEIDYLIGGENWQSGTLTIGEAVIPVSPGATGSLPWPTDGDGLPVASVVGSLQVEGQAAVEFGPLSPGDDCVEVLGEVIDVPDPDPTPDPAPVAVEQAAEQAELPRTGASALLLSLIGLFSMLSGGALLRRRVR